MDDAYLEANFVFQPLSQPADSWIDESDADYYDFRSRLGHVRIRKRTRYPATWVTVEGPVLYAGYGDGKLAQSVLQRLLAEVGEENFYEAEFLVIEANCQSASVRVQRDAFCTIPMFVAELPGMLVLASRLDTACRLLGAANLRQDMVGVMESLMGWPMLTRTLFREISVLYDRRRLLWHAGQTSLQQPPDALARTFAQQHRDADPKLFVRFLEETLDRYGQHYAAGRLIACDLSGGYDSTTVSGYLADKGYSLLTGTIEYPGASGESVRNKVQELQQRFHYENAMVPLLPATDYSLADMARADDWRPFYPTSRLYMMSHQKLAAIYAGRGIDTLFTGVGGDELCQNLIAEDLLQQGREEVERRQQTPLPQFAGPRFAAYLQASIEEIEQQPRQSTPLQAYQVIQSVGAYDPYIEQGIWPVHPLADPRLYAYCQSLPIEFRHHKQILRAYMKARRFPPIVHVDPIKEDFSEAFKLGTANLRQPMLRFLSTSQLAEQGIIDADSAITMVKNLDDYDERWYNLYLLLVTEVNLQSV